MQNNKNNFKYINKLERENKLLRQAYKELKDVCIAYCQRDIPLLQDVIFLCEKYNL